LTPEALPVDNVGDAALRSAGARGATDSAATQHVHRSNENVEVGLVAVIMVARDLGGR
jgi:hypothetical protein